MNILYLTYDGLTDPLGQSQILPYIYRLSEHGYRLTVISFEKDIETKQMEVLRILLDSKGIAWTPLSYTRRPPVVSTLYDIWRLQKTVHDLHQRVKFDLVHCRSYVTALVGRRLKRKSDVPFVFDMRGFWADERVDGGLWNLSNPIYKAVFYYFKGQEKVLLREADHIISLTHKAISIIQNWVPDRVPLPVTVVPTCVDTTQFDPEIVDQSDINHLRAQLDIHPDEFVLTYLGSLGTWYLVEEMLDFFLLIRKKIPKSRMLVVTKDDPEMILKFAVNHGLTKEAIIITSSDREQVPLHILISNWTIFFIQPFFSKAASAPTKMAEIISMGKPIVFNLGVGDMDKFNSEYDLGRGVELSNLEAVAEAVDYICANPFKKVETTLVNDHYTLSDGINKIDKVYTMLTSQKPRTNDQ